MRIQVKDFMSSPVTTAQGNNSVKEIRELMKLKGFNAVPVIQDAKQLPNSEISIRGIITATDLSKELDDNSTIENVMSSKRVYVTHKDSSAQSAAKMMLKHDVHHMVVMDEGKIIGMISSLDFVKLVSDYSLG
jgi:CBS domain-containing protein